MCKHCNTPGYDLDLTDIATGIKAVDTQLGQPIGKAFAQSPKGGAIVIAAYAMAAGVLLENAANHLTNLTGVVFEVQGSKIGIGRTFLCPSGLAFSGMIEQTPGGVRVSTRVLRNAQLAEHRLEAGEDASDVVASLAGHIADSMIEISKSHAAVLCVAVALGDESARTALEAMQARAA